VELSRPISYFIAIVAVVAAAAVTAVLWPWVAQSPTLVFFPAVMVVALYGGLGPGLLATVLSTGTLAYFFMPPYDSFKVGTADFIRLVIFVWGTVLSAALANERRRLDIALQDGAAHRAQLYRELQASLERESATVRAKGRVNAAAHETLTHRARPSPTAIKTAVGALRRGEPVAREAHHELLDVIDAEADRLHRFLDGLESTATTGATGRHLDPVPVRDLVQVALTKAAPLIGEHRIDVEEIPPGLMALVDRAAIAEVLYLVLENAIKHSLPNSRILISCVADDAEVLRVEVTDEGAGIPIELRERVFEGFVRIQRPHGVPGPGSGLGLAVARHLTTSQGGRIWIEGTPSGQGTCVVVLLPMTHAVAA
jgi:two-component system sensor histidine kinase KdpD